MGTTIPAAVFGGMFMNTIATGEEHLANHLASQYTHGLHIVEKLDTDMLLKDFLGAEQSENGVWNYDDMSAAYKQAFYDATGDQAQLNEDYLWLDTLLKRALTEDPSMTMGSFRNDPDFVQYHLMKTRIFGDDADWADALTRSQEAEVVINRFEQYAGDHANNPEDAAEYINLLQDQAALGQGVDAEYVRIVNEIDGNDAISNITDGFDAADVLGGSIPTSVSFTITALVLTVGVLMAFLFWRLIGGACYEQGRLSNGLIVRGVVIMGVMSAGLGMACHGIADMTITGSMVGYDITDNFDVSIEWNQVGRFNTLFILGMTVLFLGLMFAFFWKDDVMNGQGGNDQPWKKMIVWPAVYSVMSIGIIGQSICYADALAVIQSGSAVGGTGYAYLVLSVITGLMFTIALFKKELITLFSANKADGPLSKGGAIAGLVLAVFGGGALGSIVLYMDHWYIGTMGAMFCFGIILSYKIFHACSNRPKLGGILDQPGAMAMNAMNRREI